MGIRYYAYPVHPDDITRARADPHDYLADDPLADAWGPAETRPRMLYLDKCWRELQIVCWPDTTPTPRPSYELIEGDVVHTDRGWIPFMKALGPEDVSGIADDLALIDGDDICDALGLDLAATDDAQAVSEYEYVTQYLRAARTFVDGLRERGYGLVYMIG